MTDAGVIVTSGYFPEDTPWRRAWRVRLVNIALVASLAFSSACLGQNVTARGSSAAAELPAKNGPALNSASCEPATLLGKGAVAAPSDLASAVGASILTRGGTAADAAVAVALALGVVRPQSSGLGGGGFALFTDRDGGIKSIDFREVAPSFFNEDVYLKEGRDSRRGPWSVGVPGEARGLAELHRRRGCLSWAELVEPARRLAADGFPIEADLAAALKRRTEQIFADPGLRADFTLGDRTLGEGELCRRPALAKTLEILQAKGGDAFYSGEIADSLSEFLAVQGLPWKKAEISSYRVKERAVVSASYRGFEVASMGPPSSGGVALLQALGILEVRKISEQQRGSSAWMRSLIGALRHAFADRAAYGGDPDFVPVPVAELLDSELHSRLAARIPERGPLKVRDAGRAGEQGDLKALLKDDAGTAHLAVIDGRGEAVSLTTTVNLDFGSLQADPGTGIILNDEMDDFAARPGEPNAFGLVQGRANRVQPGKRPLSSMTPTLVRDQQGRVILAVGAAGGPRIISATLQTLLAVLDRGMSAGDAVAAPRLHHQWLPAKVFTESQLSSSELSSQGFDFGAYSYAGVVQAVHLDPTTGVLSAGADPRASGGVRVVSP